MKPYRTYPVMICAVLHFLFLASISTVLASDGKKVFCYYSSFAQKRSGRGRFLPENIDPYLCTHVIFAFVNLVNGRDLEPANVNDLTSGSEKGLYDRTMALKEQNPNLKVLLAVGGWYIGSKPFVPMTQELSNRRQFVQNVVVYLRRNGFDGLDMDWEFPATRGSPPEDKYYFTEVLKELQQAFVSEQAAYGGDKLLLTVAAAGGLYFIKQAYEPEKIVKHVDFLLLMAYNYHGSWNKETGHHSGLYPGSHETGPERQLNQQWTAQFWLNKGAPPSKIVVGIATYGMSFHLVDQDNNGVGAPSVGGGAAGPFTKESGILAYYEICQYLKQGWRRVWLDDMKAPYAYNNHEWVGYDDIVSVTLKANFIRDNGFAGAFIWSVEMDDFSGSCGEGKYPLLRTIVKILRPSHSRLRNRRMNTVGDRDFRKITESPMQNVAKITMPETATGGENMNVTVYNKVETNRIVVKNHIENKNEVKIITKGRKPKARTTFYEYDEEDEDLIEKSSLNGVPVNNSFESTTEMSPVLIMFWGPDKDGDKKIGKQGEQMKIKNGEEKVTIRRQALIKSHNAASNEINANSVRRNGKRLVLRKRPVHREIDMNNHPPMEEVPLSERDNSEQIKTRTAEEHLRATLISLRKKNQAKKRLVKISRRRPITERRMLQKPYERERDLSNGKAIPSIRRRQPYTKQRRRKLITIDRRDKVERESTESFNEKYRRQKMKHLKNDNSKSFHQVGIEKGNNDREEMGTEARVESRRSKVMVDPSILNRLDMGTAARRLYQNRGSSTIHENYLRDLPGIKDKYDNIQESSQQLRNEQPKRRDKNNNDLKSPIDVFSLYENDNSMAPTSDRGFVTSYPRPGRLTTRNGQGNPSETVGITLGEGGVLLGSRPDGTGTQKPRLKSTNARVTHSDLANGRKENGFTRNERNPYLRTGFWPRVHNSATGVRCTMALLPLIYLSFVFSQI